MHQYIGLDIGTTGAKALLVNEKGNIIGKGYKGYRLISNGSCIEQRADDWTECAASAIRQAIGENDATGIVAVSLSTQGASTVAIDEKRRPIGNALTWMDTRATEEADSISKELGNEYIYKSTGWRVNPALDAAKIMYMKRSNAYKNAVLYLSTLEYMNLFLTGMPVCDPTNASVRQIYNIRKQDYDDAILDAIGVARNELPEVLATGAPIGCITKTAADLTGLIEGTPVYNGAHDQYCASLGIGAIEKGDMLLSAGTTWVVMGITDHPTFSDSYIAPSVHPVSGLYGEIASLVGNGISLQWFKNEFVIEDFTEIDRRAAERAEKTSELFFYPYLAGANYPIWKLNARGAFTGIRLDHDRFDFARSIMEGCAFGVRRTLEDYARNGCDIHTLKIMGGAAKSQLWCAIIAAASNVHIEVSNESDACAIGAAMIAAKGSGNYHSFSDAVKEMAVKAHCSVPDPALAVALNEKYGRYQHMWENIVRYYE